MVLFAITKGCKSSQEVASFLKQYGKTIKAQSIRVTYYPKLHQHGLIKLTRDNRVYPTPKGIQLIQEEHNRLEKAVDISKFVVEPNSTTKGDTQ